MSSLPTGSIRKVIPLYPMRYVPTERDEDTIRKIILDGGIKALLTCGNEQVKDLTIEECIKLEKEKCRVKS